MYHIQVRLLFTSTYYLPYISGLTVYISRLSGELIKKGYQVNILASQHQKDLPSEEDYQGIKVFRTPYFWRLSKGFILPLYPYHVYKLLQNNDILIINLPQFEGFVSAFIAKILKKKIICIYNCEVYLPKGWVNRVIEKLLLLSTWITLQLADRVVTYTKDYAESSKLLPQFWKKVTFLYPPIPAPKIQILARKRLLKGIPPATRYTIGFAARLTAEKGIEYLLASIPGLRKRLGENFIILFIGPEHPVGEEKYFRKIKPLMDQNRKYLKFLGVLPAEEMGSFYSLLDVLILPSVNSTEAFGMVQVEAMMLGVPVVASDLPGVRVPIQKTGMGKIIPIKNTSALVEAVVDVLLHKEKFIRSRAKVESEFSLDKTIRDYLEILRED